MTEAINVNYDMTEVRRLVKRWPEITLDETEKVLETIAARLEKEVVERTPAGVGGAAGLRGSIHGEVVSFGMPVKAQVGTPLEYGEVVEYGRRPGKAMPPVDPIAKWVRSKLGITDRKEARSVGFAIARTIAREGTEGAHMFENAWKDNERWVENQLRDLPKRIVRRAERES